MSSHTESFEIERDYENVKQSCRYAFKEMQVMVKKENDKGFIANEKFSFGIYSFRYLFGGVVIDFPDGTSDTKVPECRMTASSLVR